MADPPDGASRAQRKNANLAMLCKTHDWAKGNR